PEYSVPSVGRACNQSLENEILLSLFIVSINCRRPTQACTSSRAGGHLCVLINLEPPGIKALLLFGLPRMIGSGGCDAIDPVLLTTLHTLLGFCIIGVGEVLCGKQFLFASGLDGSPASHPHPRGQLVSTWVIKR